MKQKSFAFLSIFLVLILVFTIKYFDEKKDVARVHQHKTGESIPVINIDVSGQEIEGMPIYSVDDTGTVTWARYIHENASFTEGNMEIKTDDGIQNSKIQIHVRGNSSRYFMKKSYKVHLVKDDGTNNNLSLDNMGLSNEYILYGPYLDKTLIRNYMCMNISSEIMDYAPDVRFVHLFIDGIDQGLYVLMESITREEERLNLAKSTTNGGATSYIIKLDRNRPNNTNLETLTDYTLKNGYLVYDLCYPGKDSVTDNKLFYVQKDISSIEKEIYSYDLLNKTDSYTDDLDLTSFAQYFVINEFFGNMDAGYYSTYLYKDVRGKIKLCVWDFNNACDNYMEQENGVEGFHMQYTPWFEKLVQDKRFTEEVVKQYKNLRKSYLSEEYIQNYILETSKYIEDERINNYNIYNDAFDYASKNWYIQATNYLQPLDRNYDTYEEALTQLQTYITNRGKWLDENIENIYQYSHESRTVNETLQ